MTSAESIERAGAQPIRRHHVEQRRPAKSAASDYVAFLNPQQRAVTGLVLPRDVLQITTNSLQVTLDSLQNSKSILESRWHFAGACRFVLRAVRNDGTSGDIGALIGVPYRRPLHEADGICEVGLVC